MLILISRHEAVKAVVSEMMPITRFYDFFRPEILRDVPPGSLFIGNLPIPIAASICRAGHHYQHVIIPGASRAESLTYSALKRNLTLSEYHVEEID